ncbi:hypothetical protein BDV59DRAFT_104684 [Aspergillus ambiguus]|uniref:uncharacterized protein n=1 Tax=Aspergillus ambiguus TaxID=176160 RepID=UPI003CCE50E0
MSAPNSAFQELSHIFRNRGNRILEIEILPPALGPLLQDGCSIGITKKYLAQAFVAARWVFFAESSAQGEDERLGKKLDEVTMCSEIILLFDCEHLTACNWRKQRLQDMIQRHDATSQASRETLADSLHTELTLMTTYVCSPLRRHTKSPTLWEHRLWVLRNLLLCESDETSGQPGSPGCEQSNPAMETALRLWQQELVTVLRAGELHPRNYYAFNYIREVCGVLSQKVADCDGRSTRFAREGVDPTLDWCLAHTTDISGWMFLFYLLEAVPDDGVRQTTVRRAVRFARDVGWEGESLWTFVDLAVRTFDLAAVIQEELRPTQVLHPADGDDAPTAKTGWKVWLAMAKVCWAAGR